MHVAMMLNGIKTYRSRLLFVLIAVVALSVIGRAEDDENLSSLERAKATLFTTPDVAFDHAEKALINAVRQGNEVNEALAERLMGQAKLYLNDYPGAAKYLSQALLHAQKIDDPLSLSITNRALGVLYEFSLDFDGALEQYFQAKYYAELSGDKGVYALALNNIGYVLTTMEAPDRALPYFLEAYDIFLSQKDASNQANIMAGYGRALRLLERHAEATASLDRGLMLASESEDWIAHSDVMVELGLVYLAQNNVEKAKAAFEEIINSSRSVNYFQALAIAYIELGKIILNEGDKDRAQRIYEAGLKRVSHGTTVEHELILLRGLLNMAPDDRSTITLFKTYSQRLEQAFEFTQKGAIQRFETLKTLEGQRKEIIEQNQEISEMKQLVVVGSIIVLILVILLFVVRHIIQLRQKVFETLADKNRLLKLSQEELLKVSRTDDQTGLNNRPFWVVCLDQEFERLKRNADIQSCLVFLDIDHFKQVNDTYGHMAGDQVLVKVADVLKTQLRKSDIAGRYGGEEFVILLPDTDMDNAIKFAERLREAVKFSTVTYDKLDINVTISLGVAPYLDGFTSYADWIEKADIALYMAKDKGRDMTIAEPL